MFSYDTLITRALIDSDDIWRSLDSFWRERTTTQTEDLAHYQSWASLILELNIHSKSNHFIEAQTVPIQTEWWRQTWFPLVIFEDQLNNLSLELYGDPDENWLYDPAPQIYYGETGDPRYVYPLTRPVHSIPEITDGVTDTQVVFDHSQFEYDDQTRKLTFFVDPFTLVESKTDSRSGKEYIVLWMRNSEWDLNVPFDWTGWVEKFERTGDEDEYGLAVKFIWELIVLGPSMERWNQGMMSTLGFPYAVEDDIIRRIESDGYQWIISTDTRTYTAGLDVSPIVEQGDEVTEGQPLTNGIEFWQYDNLLNADEQSIPGLALDVPESNGVVAKLSFANVDTEWSYEAGRPSEWRFPVGGIDSEVEQFWIDVDDFATANGIDFATVYGLSLPGPNPVNPMQRIIVDLMQNSVYFASVRLDTIPNSVTGFADRAALLMPKDFLLVLQQYVAEIADAYDLGTETSETVDYGYNEPVPTEVISVLGSGTDLEYYDHAPYVGLS